jgi:hypothetical protein
MVWGLGTAMTDFYMDNITFYGLESSTGSSPNVTVSKSLLNGLNYTQGTGPSTSQSFTVSGYVLTDNVVITAPVNYEVSLNSSTGYTSSVSLTPGNGILSQTPVYIRLKTGLTANSYNGDISVTTTGVSDKKVSLSGTVSAATGVKTLHGSSATIVSTEYYTLIGQRVYNIENKTGVFIEKNIMSDGTVIMSKVLKLWNGAK